MFQGCLTQQSNAIDAFTREVCKGLNYQRSGVFTTEVIEGKEGFESCKIAKTTPTNHKCATGRVFMGYNKDGSSVCLDEAKIVNPGELINNSPNTNCATGKILRFRANADKTSSIECAP